MGTDFSKDICSHFLYKYHYAQTKLTKGCSEWICLQNHVPKKF